MFKCIAVAAVLATALLATPVQAKTAFDALDAHVLCVKYIAKHLGLPDPRIFPFVVDDYWDSEGESFFRWRNVLPGVETTLGRGPFDMIACWVTFEPLELFYITVDGTYIYDTLAQ